MFLKEFAGDTPWVHLDIAGCAWNEDKKPWHAYGPSGIAVRSIVEWVRSLGLRRSHALFKLSVVLPDGRPAREPCLRHIVSTTQSWAQVAK